MATNWPRSPELELVDIGVSELVSLINQTFDYAYPEIMVTGELANLRVSKGKWLYFDLKDDDASVKFFGTVYMLPGPLEDGMLLRVRAAPRLHSLYGFSMNVQSIQPAGEGSIRKAASLLQAQLQAEGLFAAERKRPLPYAPTRIGLVTSRQSAAYADFIKILQARWGGMDITLADVQVQGEPAPRQIAAAIEQCNAMAVPPEVLVLTRGGGSAEDLAAFSTELVTRAVAASRIPTLVAIGHEVDVSLAELAADQRASTPSNAAELLVPDKWQQARVLGETHKQLGYLLRNVLSAQQAVVDVTAGRLQSAWERRADAERQKLQLSSRLLQAYNPATLLQRGYVIVRNNGKTVISSKQLPAGAAIRLQFYDGQLTATVDGVE